HDVAAGIGPAAARAQADLSNAAALVEHALSACRVRRATRSRATPAGHTDDDIAADVISGRATLVVGAVAELVGAHDEIAVNHVHQASVVGVGRPAIQEVLGHELVGLRRRYGGREVHAQVVGTARVSHYGISPR